MNPRTSLSWTAANHWRRGTLFPIAFAIGMLLSGFTWGMREHRQIDVKTLPPLLQKAIEMAPKQRFSATRVVEMKFGPDRAVHTEYIVRAGQNTRIEFPDESSFRGQIIVETPQERRHYFPDRNVIDITPPRREEFINRILRVGGPGRGNLQVDLAEGETVAGIATKQVRFLDQTGNVVQRLYIDPKSYMILKRELFDPVGTRIGYFEYQEINFKPRIDQGDFRLDRKGARIVRVIDRLREMAKQNGFTPVWVKDSKYPLQNVRTISPQGRVAILQFYEGNGHRFSLYQTHETIDPNIMRRFTRGRNTFLIWNRGDENYALLGDFTEAELRQLASKTGP